MDWRDYIDKAVRAALENGEGPIEVKAEVDAVWKRITDAAAAAAFGKP
jgi:hypothetical protein